MSRDAAEALDEHPLSVAATRAHMRKIREAYRRSIFKPGSSDLLNLIRERAARIRALTPADDARAMRGDFAAVLNDLGKALGQAPEETPRRPRENAPRPARR